MTKRLLLIFSLFLLLFTFLIPTKVQAEDPKFKEGEVIVKFKDGQAPPEIRKAAYQREQNRKSFFGRIRNSAEDTLNNVRGETPPENKVKQLNSANEKAKTIIEEKITSGETNNELDNLYVFKTDGTSFSELENLYKSLPNVESVTPNFIFKTQAVPNDPYYLDMWNLQKIQAEKAWDITKGSNDVKVAVIDTGIDYTHPELGATSFTERKYTEINPSSLDPLGSAVSNIAMYQDKMAYSLEHKIYIYNFSTGQQEREIEALSSHSWVGKVGFDGRYIVYYSYFIDFDSPSDRIEDTIESAVYIYDIQTGSHKKIHDGQGIGSIYIRNGKVIYGRDANLQYDGRTFGPYIYIYDIVEETETSLDFTEFRNSQTLILFKISGNLLAASAVVTTDTPSGYAVKHIVYNLDTAERKEFSPQDAGLILDFKSSKILYLAEVPPFDTYYLYDINTNQSTKIQYSSTSPLATSLFLPGMLKMNIANVHKDKVFAQYFDLRTWYDLPIFGGIGDSIVFFSKDVRNTKMAAYDLNNERYVSINLLKSANYIGSWGNKICFSDRSTYTTIYCHQYDPQYAYPIQSVFNNRVVDGYNFVANDNNPFDDFGHGTHVAGTIGALTDNSIGISGVAWNVSLSAIKVLDSRGEGTFDDIISGIIYSVDNGAKVINMSLGGPMPCEETMQSAINYATGKGVSVVVSAGNETSDASNSSPASCNGVIAVGATSNSDARSSYSNFGSKVDIAAPGGDSSNCSEAACLINSTYPDNRYELLQGTSMAAPHVSGAVALMLSVNPSLTPTQIETILKDSADQIITDQPIGKRLNLFNAVLAVTPGTSPSIIPSPTLKAIGYAVSESFPQLNDVSTPSAFVDSFPVTFNHTFSDTSAGIKVLAVKFFYSDGTSIIEQSSINYQPLVPTPSPTPTLTPQQQGWHYGQPNVVFEWQYHWVRSVNGYWTIFSVGQTPIGSALLVITGDPNGGKTVNLYPGTLAAASQGFDITFQGQGVSYRGTQDQSGDHVVLSSPQFSFDGTFSESLEILFHGTVQVAPGISSPDYYSRPLLVNGTMTIAGQQISLQNALSENDHQYGVAEIGISSDLSKLTPFGGQPNLTIAHDWVYASLGNIAVASTKITNRSSGDTLANYVLVQKQGEALQKANDVIFTPLEFYPNNFSKKLRIQSSKLQLDMQIEIPDEDSVVLGNVMQEDGSANVTATYREQSYSGFGIKESTDQTGPTPTPTPTASPTSVPLPTPPPKTDIDGDGEIGIFDYNILVNQFGQTEPGLSADIDQDGDVDIFDYNIIVTYFGQTVTTLPPAPTPNPTENDFIILTPTPNPTENDTIN